MDWTQMLMDGVESDDLSVVVESIHSGATVTGGGILSLAVQVGNLDVIKQLLSAGANPNEPDHTFGGTALTWARDAECTQLLVKAGAQVDYELPTAKKYSSVHNAARHGDAQRLRLLFEQANGTLLINAFNEIGYSPLHYAAEGGHLNAIEYLLQAGADPNAIDETTIGCTALATAVRQGHVQATELLLKSGANPYLFCGMTQSAYEAAKLRLRAPELLELIVRYWPPQ